MILLIEDDTITRTALAEVLRNSGHEVLEAEDGEQGLSLLDTHAVHLIITDLVLPRLDGLKVIGQSRRRRRSVPVILMSGYMSQPAGDAILATAGQKSKYLTKPVRPSTLISTVQHLLDPAV